MIRLALKPLSVNESYMGRKFPTAKLKQYKQDVALLLPRMSVPEGRLCASYIFGVSSKAADGDNLIKAFQDCLGEKYGFDDRRIYEWHVRKFDVPKGAEFIEFSLDPL